MKRAAREKAAAAAPRSAAERAPAPSPAPKPARPEGIQPYLVWAGVIALGLMLLAGRYDFGAATRRYSVRGYVTSAYMFVLCLPLLHFTLRAFFGRRRWVVGVTAAFGALCTLPYHWLGFDRLGVGSRTFTWQPWDAAGVPPSTDWFPSALLRLPAIPGEFLLFGGLLAAGVAAALYHRGRRPFREWLRDNPAWSVGLACFVLIVFQTWLHLSMRSPYTYLARYHEFPPQDRIEARRQPDGQVRIVGTKIPVPHVWHHGYLFPGGRGAVEGDYPHFRACEELFLGTPHDLSTQLLRRSFVFYLSSQFTYFFNPLHVFIVLNVLMWLAASLAAYAFALAVAGRGVAVFMALLVATGSGFIFFAAQPMTYLAGYAGQMILTTLFHVLVVRSADRSLGRFVLFGGLFGAGLLLTDMFQLVAFLVPYALLNRVPFRRTLLSLGVGAAVYGGFLVALAAVVTAKDTSNAELLTAPFGTIAGRLSNPDADQLYIVLLGAVNHYFMNLAHGFLVLPFVAALAGLALLRDARQAAVVLLLLAPSMGVVLYLRLGDARFANWQLSALPRLAYIAFPGVYLLAAVALDRLRAAARPARVRWMRAAPYAAMALIFAVNNCDVFDVPSLYYHFYFGLNLTDLLPFGRPSD